METQQIINQLINRKEDFLNIKSFSNFPGIYAIFFIGENFPLFKEIKNNQLIYIGKTESSQLKRDSKTHFSSGKTGSSTVRKSIGSILLKSENLNPIPRNDIDYKKRRFSHFKFDHLSEEKITNWMKTNLAISFYEFPKSKSEIAKLETDIIQNLIPIFKHF